MRDQQLLLLPEEEAATPSPAEKEPQAPPRPAASERRAAAIARALGKQVSEAAYLTAENAYRYRPVMRFFYEQHMAHCYSLQMDEVLRHMRSYCDDYSEALCEQDLRQLTEWGNLTSEQDRSRAHTVEEFLRRRLLYSITPYGVAFERLLVELEEERGIGGSLDVGLLETLLAALEELAPLLTELTPNGGPAEHHQGNSAVAQEALLRGVYRAWNRAYDTFDRIGKQASDYLSALDRSRDEDSADLEAFLAYKGILLQYLGAFVTTLLDHGERIRALLKPWPARGLSERLIRYLAEHDTRYNPPPDGRIPTTAELLMRHRRSWENLPSWFQTRGGLETLRRRTTAAIEHVVRQSERLMDRRLGLSRKRDLEQLAVLFASCTTLAEGHQLAGLALGCALPRHILGSAEIYLAAEEGSVWSMVPQEVTLQPVQRGIRRQGRPVPVVVFDARQEEVLREETERRQAEARLWDMVFTGGPLDLGQAEIDDPVLRTRLLGILGACLAAPDGTALASDGSLIRLALPESAQPGSLKAPDGTLYLPRFVLRREVPGGHEPGPAVLKGGRL